MSSPRDWLRKPGFLSCITQVACRLALGYPDFGLRTLTEMVIQLEGVCRAVNTPVITDAEAGFGSVLNTVRMVLDFERIGVAGFTLRIKTHPAAVVTWVEKCWCQRKNMRRIRAAE